METLCFATFARALQDVISKDKSDEKITNLLLRFVIEEGNVKTSSKNEIYTVDAKIANGLLNQKSELYVGIREASGNPDVIDAAPDYFEQSVMDTVNENRRLDLLQNIKHIIVNDRTISDEKKTELLANADDIHLSRFLSDTFVYAISKPNKSRPDGRRKKASGGMSGGQLMPAGTASNLDTLPEDTLKKIVGSLTSALYAANQTEASHFQNFLDAEFHGAIQKLIQSGKMTYYELYKFKNFLEIAEKADAELRSEDTDSCDSDDYDFDWFLRFFEAAGNVSNEDMQRLWAKVLAGEIEHQGSYSLRTVETLRNMTAREAHIFQRVSHLVLSETDGSQFLFCDDSIGNFDLNERHGLSTQDLFLLEECGLVNAFCINNIMELENASGGFVSDSGHILLVEPRGKERKGFHYKSYPLSRAAVQLLPIVWDGEYDDYLLDLGRILKQEYGEEFRFSAHEVIGISGEEIELDLENDLLSE